MTYTVNHAIKLLSRLAIASVVSAVGVSNAAAVDLIVANFSSSCSSIHLDGSLLKAQCQTNQGNNVDASFDLEPVVTNNNSQLQWELNPGVQGHYTATTSNCSAVAVNGGTDQSGFTVLECDARKGDGSPGHSRLLLDQYIENDDGHLVLRTDPHVPCSQESNENREL